MKKILMTLAAAGVLAVPVGVIIAETGPTEPTPTTVEPDRVRDQQRLAEDPSSAGDHTTEPVGNPDCDCDGAQVRQRYQYRSEEGTGEGPMIRERAQNRFEDGTADGSAIPEPRLNQPEDGTGVAQDAPATDDGANLQFQYGQGSGRANR